MSDTLDIAHFRDRLLQLRQDILALQQTRDDASQTVMLDQSSVGRLSRMDALQQQAMAQASQRNAQQMLRKISAALQRCDDGSYGYCRECDEPIAVNRLEIDPACVLCIDCAQRLE